MLGISRGTLRTALQRLEDTGEIVRRQGSGTFVGRVAVPHQLDERLERLEPYSSLARRRGVKLKATDLRIEARAVGPEVGELLELDPTTIVPTIFRVLTADGTPAAVMFDIVHPSIALPDTRVLTRKLEAGKMVLDVLLELKMPIGFARTRVMPCLVSSVIRSARRCSSGARPPRSSWRRSSTAAAVTRSRTRATCSPRRPTTST